MFTTTISQKKKTLNSIKKKEAKKDFRRDKIKVFVNEFYDHYQKMMTKLSHE